MSEATFVIILINETLFIFYYGIIEKVRGEKINLMPLLNSSFQQTYNTRIINFAVLRRKKK